MTADARPRIGTVGVHIVDTLGRTVAYVPQGQDSLRLEEIRLAPGGTAAGVAVDLATLGADVTTVGAIGDDDAGEFLTASMRRRGVGTDRLVRLEDVQTSASILLITKSGDRPALHVRGANAIVGWDNLDLTRLDGCEAVHFGGLDAMPGLDIDQTVDRMSALRSAGCLVTLDFQSAARYLEPRLLALLPQVDVFLPNEEQAAGLVGTDDPHASAARLLDHGARSVVVTCGADGAVYADQAQRLHVPAHPVDVMDTTGCGDAFSAAFILATLDRHELADVLRIASAAAGLVASGLGSDAGLTTWPDLLALTPG